MITSGGPRTVSGVELAAMDAKIVADTMVVMQRQIEQLTGARHSMYDPAIAIARQFADEALSRRAVPMEAVAWRWNYDLTDIPCAETVLFIAAPDEDGMERVWLKDCPNGPDGGAVAWSPLPLALIPQAEDQEKTNHDIL